MEPVALALLDFILCLWIFHYYLHRYSGKSIPLLPKINHHVKSPAIETHEYLGKG
jgi:hypothetical protein